MTANQAAALARIRALIERGSLQAAIRADHQIRAAERAAGRE